MPKSVWILLAALLALGAWGGIRSRDPHHTKLPFGTDDLTSVQAQLDALPQEDRELVLGYVKRSHGDFLPASLGDPDTPFTARTFSEAIELQQAFLVQQSGQQSRARGLQEQRDLAYAPLREATSVSLLGREILPVSQAAVLRADPDTPRAALAERAAATQTIVKHGGVEDEAFLATYRLQNRTSRTLESVRGSVDILKAHPSPTELSTLTGCYFTHGRLLPGDHIDFQCTGQGGPKSDERAFVGMSQDDFVVVWLPQEIRFRDGEMLEYRDPAR
ncbi:MAG: hypothetical protein ACREO0_15345 [Pseudoxanthomonas sp.]